MSITNPDCPNRFCEFCDTAEDTYSTYSQWVEAENNKGRVPGYLDEAN